MEDLENGNEILDEADRGNALRSYEMIIANAAWSKFYGDRDRNRNAHAEVTPIQTPNTVLKNSKLHPGLYYEQKSQRTKKLLKEALDRNIFLNHWTEGQKWELVASMKRRSRRANVLLLEEGNLGYYFYIVEAGRVIGSQNGEEYMCYTQADSFGETSLFSDFSTLFSYRAVEQCVLWTVDRATFLSISNKISDVITQRKRLGIQSFPLFADMAEAAAAEMLAAGLYLKLKHNDLIYDEEDSESLLYIILSGKVKIVATSVNGDAHQVILQSGCCFGYTEMFTNKQTSRDECASALDECELLVFNKPLFFKYFGKYTGFFLH